ncbi:cation transporter [Aquabacter sp. CN5-332]|uniref:cation transporter n=1 Tax=Aquabacter sp. CN5-332 TaxID=3156608 RepID=UPI0032B48389
MASISEKDRLTRQDLFASLALLVPMTYAAIVSNSSAVFADVLGLGMDTCAMFLSWLVVRRLEHGRTENYNYGFDKLENLLAVGLALANLVFVGLVLAQAIKGLRRPVPLEGTTAAIILNTASVALFAWMWWRVRQVDKAQQSPVIDAQRRFYLMGIADSLTLVIPISLGTWFKDYNWAAYIDPLTAIALCGFFVFHVWGMCRGRFATSSTGRSKNAFSLPSCACWPTITTTMMRSTASVPAVPVGSTSSS